MRERERHASLWKTHSLLDWHALAVVLVCPVAYGTCRATDIVFVLRGPWPAHAINSTALAIACIGTQRLRFARTPELIVLLALIARDTARVTSEALATTLFIMLTTCGVQAGVKDALRIPFVRHIAYKGWRATSLVVIFFRPCTWWFFFVNTTTLAIYRSQAKVLWHTL